MKRSVYVNRPHGARGRRQWLRRISDAAVWVSSGLGNPLSIVLSAVGCALICVLILGLMNLSYGMAQRASTQRDEQTSALNRNADAMTKAAEGLAKSSGGKATALSDEVREHLRGATVLIMTDEGNGWTSEGSGFVVDQSGVVVTNSHVVDYGQTGSVAVVLDSGTQRVRWVTPRIVYAAPPPPSAHDGHVSMPDLVSDIAVLQVDAGAALPALSLRAGADVRETTDAVAVGFPLGTAASAGEVGPSPSFARGAISRLQRDSAGGLVLLEHTASLESGCSGGPLVTLDGAVVGMNVGIAGERVSTAIPSERIVAVLSSLASQGTSPPATDDAERREP